YVRLPGGDEAARAPWRMALSYLDDAGEPWEGCEALRARAAQVERLLPAMRRGVASPLTSSAGRLFDAVAALAGRRSRAAFEGQAAMELEAVSAPGLSPYPYQIEAGVIDLRPAIRAIAKDAREGRAAAEIGGRFHATLAAALAEAASGLARAEGLGAVVLSGG